ncbi:4Fe-4S dicluster domain-containing protein [Hwanghaeella grinnelliae]|uniref:4Fe-4S dicluster domain-containing protein n=1 Tax=Hwanghaeella grinnelliae TaxID=2500179 RepID=A0A437QHN3_9PROT|nr:4Fe-4S binding protein [Hwanghaeella grinnelliae]RVU34063.1 4Fe-4S dicluster domain-containing protein [Hwanghaeella grinnelliae]
MTDAGGAPERQEKVLICDCEGTMTLDRKALEGGFAEGCAKAGFTQLCRGELSQFIDQARTASGLMVACTQEQQTFHEALGEADIDLQPSFVNIREQAGWSEQGSKSAPKMRALLTAAEVRMPDVPTIDMASAGVCLIYGAGDVALEAASLLKDRLNVSLLLTDAGDLMPLGAMDLMIAAGRIAGATGHLGDFEIHVNGYAPVRPSSKDGLQFDIKRDGAAARCDLIVDLSGGAPLFPSHERRDGYFKLDPEDRPGLYKVLFDIADMVGEFEKPRYVDFQDALCAHSRSRVTGCTRCLDVCPASAIKPDGDHVTIDPYLCGGCGACNSVCPTGAAGYAAPSTEALLRRVRTLLSSYAQAGGKGAVLLVHDPRHGPAAIEAMARYGRGLPADVLPFEVNEITQVGLDFLLPALAYGADGIVIMGPTAKRSEIDGLAGQVAMAEAVATGLGYDSGLVSLVLEDDPQPVEDLLYAMPAVASDRAAASFNPQAQKRTNIRSASTHLHAHAPAPVDNIRLPAGAPFGAVRVDTDGCTLCLSCVSSCPTGALTDNPDKPQLGFQESACIQCGLCKSTCPEKVITLEPRFNFAANAVERHVVYEEEPFECVSCGKPFASKSTIEKMVKTLAEKHWMFQGAAAEKLKMCEDCRVQAQFNEPGGPMKLGERPTPRTTEDYLREREEENGKN